MFKKNLVNGLFCAILILLVENARGATIEELDGNNEAPTSSENALIKWTPNSNQSTESYFKKLQDFCKKNNMSVPRYRFSKKNNRFNCKVQIDDSVYTFDDFTWES